jgi:ribosomal protein S12 methylthiotransferase accessory factor
MNALSPIETPEVIQEVVQVSSQPGVFGPACKNWPFVAVAPKSAGFGLHRIVPPETTFERVRPFFRRLGITRLADITGLDRIGIPVYSAIVPRARDVITVYNGKGFTPIDAKTGAAMEAIERFVASRDRMPDEVASYSELSRKAKVIDPRSINYTLGRNYSDETQIAWLKGLDLLSGETVFVPHGSACYYCIGYPWRSCHTVTTSNGLASGNSLEEAACHALAEVIERDAYSVMNIIDAQIAVLDARSPLIRQVRVLKLMQARGGLYPLIDVDTLPERAAFLADRFRSAGIEPVLRYAGSESGACTIFCFVREYTSDKFSHVHGGCGTDVDPSVAAVRALTEAAQSRAVDMQAMREDISSVGEQVESHMIHARRGGHYNFESLAPTLNKIPLSSISTLSSDNIVDDIDIMLNGLRSMDIERCVMVDLSVPDLPVKVVRIIAPGLESWSMDHCKIGWHARRIWRQFVDRYQ